MRQTLLGLAIAAAIVAQLRIHADYDAWRGWAGLAAAALVAALVAGRRDDAAAAPAPGAARRPRLLCGLAAVAAVAATTILGARRQQPILGLLLWLASVPLGVLAVRGWQVTPASRATPPWSRREVVALLAVLLVAGLARTLWLDTLPRGIFGDEPRVATFVRQAFADGLTVKSFFIMGWNTWPVIGLALQGALVPLLGLDVSALRASSALMGTLSVLATYLLARELSGPRLALCAALLLAICRTAIDFSRLGITHAQVLFLEPLALFHLWRALNGGRAVHWLMAGIAGGWCLYTYNAGQLVPPLLLGWLGLAALRRPACVKTHWRGAALLLAGLGLTVFPYVYYFTDAFGFGPNWEQWTIMARNRQSLGRVADAWHGAGFAPAWEILSRQVWLTWLGFGVFPGGGYGLGYRRGGMFDDVSAALFVLGLGMSLRRLAQGRDAFLLYWFLATLLAGGIATVDPPSFVRMVGLIPAVAILAALPLDGLLGSAAAPAWRRAVASAAVAGLLAGAAWINWRTYFVELAATVADSNSELARYLETRPADEHAVLLGAEYHLAFNQELFDIELPGRGRDVAEPAHFLPLHEPSGPLALILGPSQATLAAYAQALYPGTEVIDVSGPGGIPFFFRAVHIPPELARQHSGLALRGEPSRGAPHDTATADPFAPLPADLANAELLEWSGSVYWPSSRALGLRLTASRPTTITIGDAAPFSAAAGQPAEVTLTLPRGWQPMRIEERGGGARSLELRLSGEGPPRQLSRWQLRPDAGEGLRATYTQPDGVVVQAIDPQLNSFSIEGRGAPGDEPVARMPFSVTWRGALRIDVAGEYRFEAIGSGPYAISLDGTPLLAAPNVVPERPVETRQSRWLTAGLHPIEATFDSTHPAHTSRRIFQLFWTPPGGGRELIAPNHFALE